MEYVLITWRIELKKKEKRKKLLNGKTCLIYGMNTKDCKEKRDFHVNDKIRIFPFVFIIHFVCILCWRNKKKHLIDVFILFSNTNINAINHFIGSEEWEHIYFYLFLYAYYFHPNALKPTWEKFHNLWHLDRWQK